MVELFTFWLLADTFVLLLVLVQFSLSHVANSFSIKLKLCFELVIDLILVKQVTTKVVLMSRRNKNFGFAILKLHGISSGNFVGIENDKFLIFLYQL